MAANINRVVLVGNLTRDPELRHTPGGTPVCSLRVAVNSRRRDESGQWTDKPNYFSVSVFGNQAESCAQYLSKGRQVFVEGSIRTRQYDDKDGNRRYMTEVIAQRVQFLGGGGGGGRGADAPRCAGAPDEPPAMPGAAEDDDIPF